MSYNQQKSMSKQLIFALFSLQLSLCVIFRFQPPSPFKTSQQPAEAEKTNLIRRRFKNEAPIQSSLINFCSHYNFADNKCERCYQGFLLDNNNCIVDPNFNPQNKWNQLSFMKISSPAKVSKELDLIILSTNPFCSSLTPDGALCMSCYKTHKLENGKCIEKEDDFTLAEQLYLRPMQVPKHTFCKTFDSEGNCTSCYSGSTYNGSQCVIIPRHDLDCRLHQFCVPKSTECLTYSTEGLCKSCPYDAINMNGVCRINRPESLCVEIDQNQKCKKCSSLGFLRDGICRYRSPNCLEYNQDKISCNTCMPTFRRENGECIRVAKIMFINIDPNCATWKEGRCIQCKFGFEFYQKYCFDVEGLKAKEITPLENLEN